MKAKWLFLVAVASWAFSVSGQTNLTVGPPADVGKAWRLFVKAVENDSTAPNYVLVTVVNDNTGKEGLVCTQAPFLLGAIHRQYRLPYDDDGIRRAKNIALEQKDRRFHFSSTEALKNIPKYYGDSVLAEVRTTLKGFTEEELCDGFHGDGKGLERMYVSRGGQDHNAYRDAIAHYLTERGLLVACGCGADLLSVKRVE